MLQIILQQYVDKNKTNLDTNKTKPYTNVCILRVWDNIEYSKV